MSRVLWGSPPRGYETYYDPNMDSGRSSVTKAITFSQITSKINTAKNGDIESALDLFAEMEETDGRLKGALRTRRLAVSGLESEIVSAAEIHDDNVDKTLADEASQYVRETLDGLDGWPECQRSILRATGPNLAVAEVVWEMGAPVAIHPVRRSRLTQDFSKDERIRIVTRKDPLGVPATNPKYIVHVPDGMSGTLIENSLSRSLATIWLTRRLAIADWAAFAELFGLPIRMGRYDSSATPAEKKMLKEALQNMGSAAWAMFSRSVEVELVESSQRGTSPFEALVEFCSREMAIAVLGGNLTTDNTGGTGSLASASVQDEVRNDIRDDDIRSESDTYRHQLIAPMVALKFPMRNVPMPVYRRVKPESIDRVQEAAAMRGAQQIGISIPKEWAQKRLGIPEIKKGEEVLTPPDAFEDAIREEGTNAFA